MNVSSDPVHELLSILSVVSDSGFRVVRVWGLGLTRISS